MSATVTVEGKTAADVTVAGGTGTTISAAGSGTSVAIPGHPLAEVAVSTALSVPGPPGPPGAPGGGSATIPVTAHANLSGHRVVKQRPDGTVDYADPSTPGDKNLPLWLTLTAIAVGATGDVQVAGEVTEPTWNWTAGLPLYLTPSGTLSHTPPNSGFIVQVASALSSVLIFWDPKVPIALV